MASPHFGGSNNSQLSLKAVGLFLSCRYCVWITFTIIASSARHQDILLQMSSIRSAQILPVIAKRQVMTLKCRDKWVHLENNHFFFLFDSFPPVSPTVVSSSDSDLWPLSNQPSYWEVKGWEHIRHLGVTQNRPLCLCPVCNTVQFSCV